jgi:hypothetical protein
MLINAKVRLGLGEEQQLSTPGEVMELSTQPRTPTDSLYQDKEVIWGMRQQLPWWWWQLPQQQVRLWGQQVLYEWLVP